MRIDLNLETILAIVITFLALNLIFIGFYITSVLREIKKTVSKAGKVIDDVDKSVNDGIGKAAALEKPLQALATTSVALSSVIRSANFGRKTTSSILPSQQNPSSTEPVQNLYHSNAPQMENMGTPMPDYNTTNQDVNLSEQNREQILQAEETTPIAQPKKKSKRPKLFKSSRPSLN